MDEGTRAGRSLDSWGPGLGLAGSCVETSSPPEQTDRQTRLKTLLSVTSLAGGKNFGFGEIGVGLTNLVGN